METIRVTIAGKTPLLVHRFTDAAQQEATTHGRLDWHFPFRDPFTDEEELIRLPRAFFEHLDVELGALAARASTVGDRGTPKAQAEESLYKDEDGNLIIPQPNLFRAVLDAGKFFKNGRSKVTTQKSSLIPACVEIEELAIPIEHDEPWTVDTRPVRIPSTGGRILRHRACFNDWALSFTLRVDTEILSTKLLRDIVDAAGTRIGLGDFRPDCKGPFGKFVVTKWEVKTEASDA